jgi:hypothetical protein
MSSYNLIRQKLEAFIKKYYVRELIKGIILFFAIGLLYFLITLLIEYFLWLKPALRTLLFWVFVLVETSLFIRFIAFPLLKLFRLQKGLNYEQAAKIIGNHFPEVNDKLLNVIQLNQNQRQSELLLASIEQKSNDLEPIPFKKAIPYKSNLKYLKYALIPIALYFVVQFFGDKNIFSSSYKRIVNYNVAYEPPAPFQFLIENNALQTLENKNFTLYVKTIGDIAPQNATIQFNNESYYLDQTSPGLFEYTFSQPLSDISFKLQANKVVSPTHTLKVIKTPALVDLEMVLDYPAYTQKKDGIKKGTGNALVPEGTRITWRVKTKNTQKVALKEKDTSFLFKPATEAIFTFQKKVYNNQDYTITTSNKELTDYENLSFTISVLKDQYPQITVQSKKDSITQENTYHLGDISDDYGISKLELVYYPIGEENNAKRVNIPVNNTTIDRFALAFPGDLELLKGVAYEYYFAVYDNDVIHNHKRVKSALFSFRKPTDEEKEDQQLNKQEETIKGLDKTLKNLKNQDKTLEELSKLNKEKNQLNWNDKKKLENFLKRQKQQEEIMKQFSKELKENLENFQPEEKDPFKEELQNRLEENEKKLQENEKLLEELEKLQEKIEQEELSEQLEKLSKNNKNQERNLEQLVELTKRYYVEKKAEKLAEDLFKMAEDQEKLAEELQNNKKEEQDKLNERFEEFQKEMNELQKENKALKEPIEIPQDSKKEEEVKQEQQKASENLEQQKKEDAKKNQKKAAQKMKQMSQQMSQQMQAMQMETIEEDVEMLRQILDNLVVFSIKEESLMKDFKTIDYGNPIFGKKLAIQHDYKENFEHIDDSLFALSLRQPLLSEKINEAVTNIQFNLEKSLERLAENQLMQGYSSQQYVVSGANELALLLSDILGNMMEQLGMGSGSGSGKGKGQGKGQGEGQGFQLPDIIKKQESLAKKMEEGMKKGQQGKSKGEGEGQGEGTGEGEGKGDSGKDGKQGKDGKSNTGKEGNKEGTGDNEELNGLLFEIYKQQQQLRNQLEDRLKNIKNKGQAGNLLREMKQIEQQLLDKGFNQRTLEKMLNLKHQLLKLDKATFEQGKENKRQSETNRKNFTNTLRLSPEDIKTLFNTDEILNRESLPLQPVYKKKVQKYFNNND